MKSATAAIVAHVQSAPVAKTSAVSTFARFVLGDIKGGEHAKAYRMETIRAAIEQMFKGNYSPITEAATLTEGKAKKARAYHAGFATFGVVGTDTKKVTYVGRLDAADNKEARDRIESLTEHHTATFFAAFDAVMAEKAVKKSPPAETPAPAPAASTVAEQAPAEQDADDLRAELATEQEEAVFKVVAMLKLGHLSAEHVLLIETTLAAHRTAPVQELATA